MSVTFAVDAIATGRWTVTVYGDECTIPGFFSSRVDAQAAALAHQAKCTADYCDTYPSAELDVDVSVNFSNSNAVAVLRLLGLSTDDLCGGMPGGDFLACCQVALAAGTPALHARPAVDVGGPGTGHARFVDAGLTGSDLMERVRRLADIATEAHRLNRDITWG